MRRGRAGGVGSSNWRHTATNSCTARDCARRGRKPSSARKVNASAKVTLLAGKDKQEVTLAPAGADKLEAKGNFMVGPGTKIVAVVTNADKLIGTARFEISRRYGGRRT